MPYDMCVSVRASVWGSVYSRVCPLNFHSPDPAHIIITSPHNFSAVYMCNISVNSYVLTYMEDSWEQRNLEIYVD